MKAMTSRVLETIQRHPMTKDEVVAVLTHDHMLHLVEVQSEEAYRELMSEIRNATIAFDALVAEGAIRELGDGRWTTT